MKKGQQTAAKVVFGPIFIGFEPDSEIWKLVNILQGSWGAQQHSEREKVVRAIWLTRKQKEVFDFVVDYVRSHGYPPIIEEIREHFGFASLATVHKHLKCLEKKGAIRKRPHEARGIEVLAS